jgi:hypothetical protein
MRVVISLYDFTGTMVKPWAKAGFECFCFDLLHENWRTQKFRGGGCIHYVHADLHSLQSLRKIAATFDGADVAFVAGFPVCTHLAVSGAAHFARKRREDPQFQTKAAQHAKNVQAFVEMLRVAEPPPFCIENPVSVLSSLWRKPNFCFHPYEYGGYVPPREAAHPVWPKYIAPRDAYTKKTCLWTGNDFRMPEKRPVALPDRKPGQRSKQMMLWGGHKDTKTIRSATPRGFAQAVFEANSGLVRRRSVRKHAPESQ